MEWAKKTPRKKIESWKLSYTVNDEVTSELQFSPDDKSCTLPNPKPGATYSFKIAAANSSGTSEWSEAVLFLSIPGPQSAITFIPVADWFVLRLRLGRFRTQGCLRRGAKDNT